MALSNTQMFNRDTVTARDPPEMFEIRQGSTSSTIFSIHQRQGPEEEENEFEHRSDGQHRHSSSSDTQSCGTVRENLSTYMSEKAHQAEQSDKEVQSGNTLEDNIVTWSRSSDPRAPMNWSPIRKWTIVITSSLMTFVVSFSSSVFSATIYQTAEEFSVPAEVMLLGIALYVLGFAFGPVIWGPASELYGRTLPLWIGTALFLIFQIPLGLAQNLQTIMVARFCQGFFGSAPLAILAGLYVDLLPPIQLGIAVAVFSAGVFCGPALGPIFGSLIVNSYLGWRWTAWITMIVGAFFTVVCFCFTPETFEPVLLRRIARQQRSETKNSALHAACEAEPTDIKAFATKFVTKPVRMIIAEPILAIFTVYISVVYGILYLTFEAYPISFSSARGWSATIGTLPFLSLFIGVLVACGLIGLHSVFYVGARYKKSGQLNPEDRLPTMILGGIMLPVGLFWFAWTSDPALPWPAQVVSCSFTGCGIILIFMSAVIYLVDVYLLHSNSAMAINTFVRSIVAAGFPMFATYLYKGLGVNWATSLLGFICVALMPFPLLFWRYGRTIRGWSKFAVVLPAPA